MYDHHYNYVMPKYPKTKLLFTDTDRYVFDYINIQFMFNKNINISVSATWWRQIEISKRIWRRATCLTSQTSAQSQATTTRTTYLYQVCFFNTFFIIHHSFLIFGGTSYLIWDIINNVSKTYLVQICCFHHSSLHLWSLRSQTGCSPSYPFGYFYLSPSGSRNWNVYIFIKHS